jgi:hypothetical protein
MPHSLAQRWKTHYIAYIALDKFYYFLRKKLVEKFRLDMNLKLDFIVYNTYQVPFQWFITVPLVAPVALTESFM